MSDSDVTDSVGEDSLYWLKAVNRFNAAYVIPAIVVVGMLSNLLALAVFVFSPLRKVTIAVYLAALSTTDFVFLAFLGVGWLDSVGVHMFHIRGFCQIMVFMTFVVSFLSLWFIVTFTAELYMSIYCTRLHRVISRPKRASILSLLLVLVACVIYLFSFWYSGNVQIGHTKYACLFTGSPSSAITASIADTILTLLLPFSLLLFMNIRIIHTLASVSKTKYKTGTRSPTQSSSVAAGNLLAELMKMANRARKASPRFTLKKSGGSRVISNITKIVSPLSKSNKSDSSVELAEIHVGRGKRISLTLPDGEVSINNSAVGRDRVSVTRLFVQNEGVGITVSSQTEARGRDDNGDKRRRRSSNTETNILITSASSASSNTVRILDQQIHNEERPKGQSSLKKQSRDLMLNRPRYSIEVETMADLISEQEQETEEQTKDNEMSDRDDKKSAEAGIVADGEIERDDKTSEQKTGSESGSQTQRNPISQLQIKCLRIVLAITVVFLTLNLPCHAIRLQSLIRSIFFPAYQTSEKEYHLQQLFQTIYYLNFVINFFTYSACAKSFQQAFLNLPRHITDSCSQMCYCVCGYKDQRSFRREGRFQDLGENSRLVEICISELHLSQIPSFGPDFKYVSPPCLLRMESSNSISKNSRRDSEHSINQRNTAGTGTGTNQDTIEEEPFDEETRR